MRIGEVARRAGVSVDAVRYYERRGLVRAAERTPSGYREFTADAPDRIADVKVLQSLGLTLDDIEAVLARSGGGAVQCHHADGTLSEVIDRIEARIAELTGVRDRATRQQVACRNGECSRSPMT